MTLREARKSLLESIGGHLQSASDASRIVKGILLIAGAFIAGLAQFLDIKGDGIQGHQILGIVGCLMVFLAGVWFLIVENNATDELKIAAKAIETAQEAYDKLDEIDLIQYDLDRATNLLVAHGTVRSFLERMCSGGNISTDDQIVEEILGISSRYISLSMGLDGGNEWTLCAYKAISDASGKDKLQLVAHARAIDCDKSEGRSWEEGVGVTGICYSMEREVIVPQLQSQGIGSLFNVGERSRAYDASRHQSIIAVPIQIDKGTRPWGVLTASSDRPDHFLPHEPGVQHAEGARVLAGAMALGIAIRRRLAQPSPVT